MATTTGSSSRTFGIVLRSAGVPGCAPSGVSAAAYSCTLTPASPYAARVSLMFRWMYGASRSASLGRTWKYCTTHGYTPPMSRADSTSRPNPSPGSRHPDRNTLTKNSVAHSRAIAARIVFAGSSAFTSV